MGRLVIAATLVFWLGVGVFWAIRAGNPDAAQTSAAARERAYDSAELARHATSGDCWMAIDGQVYDFTTYVADHPADPTIFLPWCGREASLAYRTKTKNRPHSARADRLLPEFRIGTFSDAR